MRVGILGAAEAESNGAAGRSRHAQAKRALLAAFAMHRGRPVPPDTIVDLLWGETPPAAVTATLQGTSPACLKDLAAEAYAALSEFSGQPACAGSGTSLGPVDAFLAMAAEATGERDLATRHANDAACLCDEWRIPVAGEWFADLRSKFGF